MNVPLCKKTYEEVNLKIPRTLFRNKWVIHWKSHNTNLKYWVLCSGERSVSSGMRYYISSTF